MVFVLLELDFHFGSFWSNEIIFLLNIEKYLFIAHQLRLSHERELVCARVLNRDVAEDGMNCRGVRVETVCKFAEWNDFGHFFYSIKICEWSQMSHSIGMAVELRKTKLGLNWCKFDQSRCLWKIRRKNRTEEQKSGEKFQCGKKEGRSQALLWAAVKLFELAIDKQKIFFRNVSSWNVKKKIVRIIICEKQKF